MFITRFYRQALWVVLLSGFPLTGFAILPVFDSGAIFNLIKNFQQLQRQYSLLERSYHNAEAQLSQAKQLVSDSEGHYGYGHLLDDGAALKNRQWSPDTWQGALNGLSGGNPNRYQELLKQYSAAHPTLSVSDYEKGASKEKSKLYQDDLAVNRAAMVNASYAFNNIKSHLDTIHRLSGKIDEAKNMKASMDLNSRLTAEVAYIQTQELKMQVLMNQQVAEEKSNSITENSLSAKFNTLPEE